MKAKMANKYPLQGLKKIRLLLFYAPLILILTQTPHKALSQDHVKILILGDSLTEGYGVEKNNAFPHVLEKLLNDAQGPKKFTIINGGISGSTTASCTQRLNWYLKTSPHIVVFALGANDGLRGVPPKNSHQQLKKCINIALKLKIKVLLAGMKAPPNYGKPFTKEFNAIYSKLSQDLQIPLMPFLLKGVAGEPKYNLSDGIHPNEKGHTLIAKTLLKHIKELL